MKGIKSKSEVFKTWVKEVDEILSSTQTVTANGDPIEYGAHHFQDQLKRLCNCSMNFTDMPIYPINEQIAVDLLWDEIEAKQEEIDATGNT